MTRGRSTTRITRPSRAGVLTALVLAILLAWGGIHFWTLWHDNRPVTMSGTVHAEWIPDAEWSAIDPHPGVTWNSPLTTPDGHLATRAVLLRITLHADRYGDPGNDQNASTCRQIVFTHPEFPHWSVISAGPLTMSGATPSIGIERSSTERDFLAGHLSLMSPQAQGEGVEDFGLQLTDPNVSYLTAVAVVPADATGDPGSVRAWASSTCTHDVTFTELNHAA